MKTKSFKSGFISSKSKQFKENVFQNKLKNSLISFEGKTVSKFDVETMYHELKLRLKILSWLTLSFYNLRIQQELCIDQI